MKPTIQHSRTNLARYCVPLVLAATLLSACATTRDAGQELEDSNVTLAVGTKLMLDSQIDRYRIDVDTLNGVVTLRGSVDNAEQRSDSERISKATDGVKDVVNELQIDTEPRTASARFEDTWITGMINSKLSVDPEVRSRNVDIDVIEGVVTLSGIVETKVARGEAEDLANSVDGVVRVINELQVEG